MLQSIASKALICCFLKTIELIISIENRNLIFCENISEISVIGVFIS